MKKQTGLLNKPRIDLCPTCGQQAEFVFLGEQRWPLHVAQAAGVGPVVHLWQCRNCQTTLTEAATPAAS